MIGRFGIHCYVSGSAFENQILPQLVVNPLPVMSI